MKKLISTMILCGLALVANAQKVASPNGKLSASTDNRQIVVSYGKQQVLKLADTPFDKLTFVRKIKDDYQMLEGKTPALHQRGQRV